MPSVNHPPLISTDDDNDGNDEGTSRASTPFPTRFVNSLSNDIPQIFLNPPNVDRNMEAFYSRQTEILNRQVQLRDEQRGGIRPSNPIPLQSHPFLDITLSLSPITPLDHILDTPSPPSPQPPPQPPLIGHPIYFNYHDYHVSTCLCCFHNRNLFFTLRDEMNLTFAHLKYLLTSVIASPSPPHP
ncbi:hypothetical protein Tco_0505423 [Tanacetum coccineum]